MSDYVLADTGPLYALADPSDQYHVRACRESDRIQVAGLHPLTPYPVLCEAYTLVLRRLGRAYAAAWLGQVTAGVSLVNPEASGFVSAFVLLRLLLR